MRMRSAFLIVRFLSYQFQQSNSSSHSSVFWFYKIENQILHQRKKQNLKSSKKAAKKQQKRGSKGKKESKKVAQTLAGRKKQFQVRSVWTRMDLKWKDCPTMGVNSEFTGCFCHTEHNVAHPFPYTPIHTNRIASPSGSRQSFCPASYNTHHFWTDRNL